MGLTGLRPYVFMKERRLRSISALVPPSIGRALTRCPNHLLISLYQFWNKREWFQLKKINNSLKITFQYSLFQFKEHGLNPNSENCENRSQFTSYFD